MIEAPSFALAFAAGVISFLSPCCLPLVPGYIGYLSGMSGGAPRTPAPPRWRPVVGSGLFVAGFSVVFIAMSVVISSLGMVLAANQDLLLREKILVVQGTGFNWPRPDHLRLVTLPWTRDIVDAIERLGNFLAGYRQ